MIFDMFLYSHPIQCPGLLCHEGWFGDTFFGSQSDAPVTNEAAVISMIWIERNVCLFWCGKKRPNQRPKDVLFKPTSPTYATEKLTWNLKIICLKSKSQLPSTIFRVPCHRLGVGTPTKTTADFGRSKKPSTKQPKEKDLIQKDQFFATDLAPLGSWAFWYRKVEFY